MKIARELPAAGPGPAEWFTGSVELARLAVPDPPARVTVFRVAFPPEARTAWHTHPFGQVLHVVEGTARIAREGENPVDVPAGATVWFEPDERHWHGATPDGPMTHIAIQEARPDGSSADWAEHVSDADYRT